MFNIYYFWYMYYFGDKKGVFRYLCGCYEWKKVSVVCLERIKDIGDNGRFWRNILEIDLKIIKIIVVINIGLKF